MTVNVVSESQYAPNFFRGMHTAFMSHIKLLRKNNIRVKINSFGKADITHIHSLGPFALYKMLTSKHIVVSTHTIPDTMIGTFRGSRYWGRLFKKYLKFFYNKADLIILFSPYMAEELKKIGINKKMAIIANPIDTSFFVPDPHLKKLVRKKFNIKEDAVVILGAGHVVKRKGIIDFVAVAKTMPEYEFFWVGGKSAGIIRAGVKKSYLKKNLSANMHFLGSFSYKEMHELYNMADILFFPSYQETQGLVIVEAAACGLPLILRDLPEYRSLYDNSYYSCRTNNEFVKAIKGLAMDKENYNEARKTSLSLAKKFSMETLGKKLLFYYTELLQVK
ncbi:MAG TPA: glycosyltransferase family 4 protein [Candidatus Sulfotelmatobacter sp.]|jgi:1,2-diacylglycerol-3-alpha-glucose alpha-1,2-galactosyltransferase|nr:glycosyltransferase family 4 protein [Candidatus Sulfotelmatobacter sp.]